MLDYSLNSSKTVPHLVNSEVDTVSTQIAVRETFNQNEDLNISKVSITDTFEDTSLTSHWQKAFPTVESTVAVANNILTVDGGSYRKTAWMHQNAVGYNTMQKITFTGNGNSARNPALHTRIIGEDFLLITYFDLDGDKIKIAKFSNGVLSTIKQKTYAFIDTLEEYTLIVKTYENRIEAIVLNQNNEIIMHIEDSTEDKANETVNGEIGTKNGIGSAGDPVEYKNYSFEKYDTYNNVVFIGDSQTAGNGLDTKDMFVHQIQNEFLTENISCINAGVSGNQTTHILTRLETDVFERAVDNARNVMVLMVGTNDLNSSNRSPEDIFINLKNIIEQAQTKGWEVVLMTIPPRENASGYAGINDDIIATNAIIRENAYQLQYQVIDLWGVVVDPSDSNKAKTGYLQSDLLHLSEIANEEIANLIIEELAILKSRRNILIPDVHILTQTITGDTLFEPEAPITHVGVDATNGNVRVDISSLEENTVLKFDRIDGSTNTVTFDVTSPMFFGGDTDVQSMLALPEKDADIEFHRIGNQVFIRSSSGFVDTGNPTTSAPLASLPTLPDATYPAGESVTLANGTSWRVLTIDGLDTWIEETQDGALLVDPTAGVITAGVSEGAELVANRQNYIYNGTEFLPYPGASDTGATGTVTPGTVGSAPTTSTVGTEGELTTDGSTCYILRELTVAASLPAGPFSIFSTTGGNPYGITIDSAGNIYTANQSSNNVSKITPAGVSTILGTTGSSPRGIVIDSAGNIYITNQSSANVSKITPAGVSTILGTTGSSPRGITIDSAGNIYTANRLSNNVSKITPAGVSTILGTTGGNPYGITIDSAGNIYTANQSSNNVSKITPAGVSTILGTTGSSPRGIVIDSAGNIYITNQSSANVSKITPAGVSTILGTTGSSPYAITIDSAGNIYTANSSSANVSKITPTGVSTILGTTGSSPRGIAIDSDGNIYTTNYLSNNVSKSTNDGLGSSTYTWDTITCPSTDAWILSNGDFTLSGGVGSAPTGTGDVVGRTATDDSDVNSVIHWRWDGTEWVNVTPIGDTVYTLGDPTSTFTGTYLAQGGETVTVQNGIIVSVA